jgi:hypothetical protein
MERPPVHKIGDDLWAVHSDDLRQLLEATRVIADALNRVVALHANDDGFCVACSTAFYQDDELVGWYQAQWPCDTIQALQDKDTTDADL